MTKRAQLLSHPILAIFTLIVISILLIFGFTMIRKLLTLQEAIGTKEFAATLQRAVDTTYREPPGSSSDVTLRLSSTITTVCFLNLANPLDTIASATIRDEASAFASIGNAQQNVFFATTSGTKTPDPLTINKLQPSSQTCISTRNGILTLALENKGRNVDIVPV